MTLSEEIARKHGLLDDSYDAPDWKPQVLAAIKEAFDTCAALCDEHDDNQADAECMCCVGDKIRALELSRGVEGDTLRPSRRGEMPGQILIDELLQLSAFAVGNGDVCEIIAKRLRAIAQRLETEE